MVLAEELSHNLQGQEIFLIIIIIIMFKKGG
jgi:hypothetical protein